MKFSIGHRLFIAVLLAISAVTAAGLAFMRSNVMHSFANYAAKIELDRLQGLAEAMQLQYREYGSWAFLPEQEPARANWVRTELARLSDKALLAQALQTQRAHSILQLQAAQAQIRAAEDQIRRSQQTEHELITKSANAAASLDALQLAQEQLRLAREQQYTAKAQVLSAKEEVLTFREQIQQIERVLPPPAPATPVPPAPDVRAVAPVAPVPAPPPAPAAAPAPPAPPAPPLPALAMHGSGALEQNLQDRIALVDAKGNWLAGRRPDGKPTVERPVDIDGAVIGYLRLTRATGPSDAMASEFIAEQKRNLGLVVLVSIALSALAAVLLAAHFRKPVRILVDAARKLAKGQFDTRLDIARSDELGELASSFNHLASKLEHTEQSRRQWVADTSHELRTPLSVLRAQIEAMQDGIRSPTPEHIATMLRQVLSLSKLVDELYELARADEGHFDYRMEPLDLWRLACDEAAGFAEKLHAAGLALSFGDTPAASRVMGDPDRIRQVLCNLLENCVRYSSAGGRVELHGIADKGLLAIVIDDTAPAVPDAALARLTERFFRVEQSRNRQQGGSGLGLAMCQRIVEAHGGTLQFTHSPLGGLRVTVTLPLEQA